MEYGTSKGFPGKTEPAAMPKDKRIQTLHAEVRFVGERSMWSTEWAPELVERDGAEKLLANYKEADTDEWDDNMGVKGAFVRKPVEVVSAWLETRTFKYQKVR